MYRDTVKAHIVDMVDSGAIQCVTNHRLKHASGSSFWSFPSQSLSRDADHDDGGPPGALIVVQPYLSRLQQRVGEVASF